MNDPVHPESDGGWSDGDVAPAEDLSGVTDGARYARGTLLGAGGMGRVYAAWDARLGREVALKVVRPDGDDPLGRRLAHEARITARLEHPGVVPVYDAGTDAGGERFYTMRLVRGRSLAEALTEGEDGVRLLRLALIACQTAAFAHARGVVHRDLKPSNILLGPFGEVLLVDWGVALEQHPETIPSEAHAVVGTEGYRSPEQAAGEAVDARSDVWSLGRVLEEIVDRGAQRGQRCAPALRAILDRAQASEPAKRYRDAGALADDLAAWLDGRRVDAHVYTPWEAARVVLSAWRIPLRAVGVASLVAIVGGVVAYARIRDERDRAAASEVAAVDALAGAFAEQAVVAARDGQRDLAERRAAAALALRPDPRARGVFVGFGAPRPHREVLGPLPCASPWVRGTFFLCATEGSAALFALGEDTPRWRVASSITDASVSARLGVLVTIEDQRLVERDLKTGKVLRRHAFQLSHRRGLVPAVFETDIAFLGLEQRVLNVSTGRVRHGESCGAGQPAPVTAYAHATQRVALLCADGSVRVGPLGGMFDVRIGLEGAADGRGPTALALGEALWLGYPDGRVERRSTDTGAVLPGTFDAGAAVRGVELGEDVVALSLERGGVLLVDPSLDAPGVKLPDGEVLLRVAPSGAETLGSAGHARWSLPPEARGALVTGGLSSIAIGPGQVVLGAGNGQVRTLDTSNGTVERVMAPGGLSVVRSVATTRGGRLVLGYAGSGGLWVRAAKGTWSALGEVRPYRRVAARDETILALGYDGTLFTFPEVALPSAPRWVDLASDGAWVWLLDDVGGVWAWSPGTLAPAQVAKIPYASAIASSGGKAVVVTDAALWRIGAAGGVSPVPRSAGRLTALATDGTWIATGDAEGRVHVIDGHDVNVALVHAHAQRVSALGFGGGVLWSAGWDGVLRRLDPSVKVPSKAQLDDAWGPTPP